MALTAGGCFGMKVRWSDVQTCNKQRQYTIMQQHHTLFSEKKRHDGYHENLDTNRGGPVQKEVPDCIAEVIHQNIPT